MSPGTNPLEGRYRRLLLAYPRRYRRVRGLEMLTMLLDDAEAGRTRPTLAETVDLVLGGLRCRLRPPGRRGVRILATFLAFTGAALGTIGGTWLGWSSAAPLPADTRGVAIVLTAINDPRTGEPDADVERSFDDIPRATVGRDTDWAGADIRSRDPGATVAKASRNLATAGWQVHSTRPDQIDATKGDVTVQVWTEDQSVWFSFERRQPLAVPLLAITGALLGGLLAWQLTGWAARRTLAGARPGPQHHGRACGRRPHRARPAARLILCGACRRPLAGASGVHAGVPELSRPVHGRCHCHRRRCRTRGPPHRGPDDHQRATPPTDSQYADSIRICLMSGHVISADGRDGSGGRIGRLARLQDDQVEERCQQLTVDDCLQVLTRSVGSRARSVMAATRRQQ